MLPRFGKMAIFYCSAEQIAELSRVYLAKQHCLANLPNELPNFRGSAPAFFMTIYRAAGKIILEEKEKRLYYLSKNFERGLS